MEYAQRKPLDTVASTSDRWGVGSRSMSKAPVGNAARRGPFGYSGILSSRQLPYWLLVCALVTATVLSRAASEGMFLDGLVYAVISRNFAEGLGTAWDPYFSATMFPHFSEHPPASFWFQAVAFRLFGDSVYVEKLYFLFPFVLTTGLICLVWRRITGDEPLIRPLYWLPVLLWLSVGSVTWAYGNNILENTMTVFTTLAVYLVLLACEASSWPRRLAQCSVAGIAVCVGTLTTGPTGFFPLAAFGCYWLATLRISLSTAVACTAIMISAAAAVFAVLFSFEPSREGLLRYLDIQLMESLTGLRGETSTHDKIRHFATVLGTPMLITSLVLAFGRLRQIVPAPAKRHGAALFLLLVGLSGSLPILVSPRVSGHYLNPSVPFFALACALYAGTVVARLDPAATHRGRRYLLVAAAIAVLAASGYAASRIGTDGRDRDLLREIRAVAALTDLERPAEHWSLVPVCADDWSFALLHAYVARYYKASLRSAEPSEAYMLATPNCSPANLAGYTSKTPIHVQVGLYSR